MAFVSIIELLYLIILVVFVGYIFTGIMKRRDPLHFRGGFDWQDFKLACIVAAPGILLHELAHKFTAMGFGLDAAFNIWPFGIFLGVLLKVIGSPFILIAPGYVNISTLATNSQMAFIAFAGPFINLLLWLIPSYILNHKKRLTRNQAVVLYFTKVINMWLFIFNMIPIPPLDGSKVLEGLLSVIF